MNNYHLEEFLSFLPQIYKNQTKKFLS